MRWEDESYVRLYKRETPEWAVLSWEARALFHEMLKKVDLAGILMVGKSGIRGLAGLVRMPVDVVERALHSDDGLLADGCVVAIEGGFMMPNYVEAQQAKSSDRARKQEQRARARAAKLATSQSVTPSHTVSEPVDEPDNTGQSVTPCDDLSRSVTERHAESHAVTRGHSELSVAKQSEAEVFSETTSLPPPPETGPPDGGGSLRDVVVRELRRSPMTDFVANDEFSMGAVMLALDRHGLGAADIPPAIEWAVEQLEIESATVGGGFPLNLETTVRRVTSGLKGEKTKRGHRPRQPDRGALGAPIPAEQLPKPSQAAISRALDQSYLFKGRQ